MTRMKAYDGLLCVALLLAMAGGAAAQEFRATVKGQVVDSSQGALPGATVTVRNQETGEVERPLRTSRAHYTLPFLRPGLYSVTVEMSGFQKYTRTDMRLQVSQVAVINAQLNVGGITESVNVSAESPLLESSNANRGTVIDSARIAELPLQSRSPMALAVLVAGVNYNAQAIYLRPFDNGALADWSMNGGQNRNNEFLLDGAPNNANQGGNNIAYVPPAEAVQEFKVSTNTYDAQYGRTAGGVINMSLKSGTNTFHGVGYDFMRRKGLAANSFLLNSRKAPKTDQYIDQYGFVVDGPIWKNKTFFLFNAEKYREGTPAPLNSTTPTAAMKRGYFSGLSMPPPSDIIKSGERKRNERRVTPIRSRHIIPRSITTLPSASAYYPDPNYVTAVAAPCQNTCTTPITSTRTFLERVGKVDPTSPRTIARSPWGENDRNEIRNTPVRSGPRRTHFSWRANARIVGDWCHFRAGPCSTCAPARRTSWIELFPDSLGSTRRVRPATLVNHFQARHGGIFPSSLWTTT